MGLLIAFKDELEAADSYKDVILSSTDKLVRDTFFLAMGDELEHATRFSFLYNLFRWLAAICAGLPGVAGPSGIVGP